MMDHVRKSFAPPRAITKGIPATICTSWLSADSTSVVSSATYTGQDALGLIGARAPGGAPGGGSAPCNSAWKKTDKWSGVSKHEGEEIGVYRARTTLFKNSARLKSSRLEYCRKALDTQPTQPRKQQIQKGSSYSAFGPAYIYLLVAFLIRYCEAHNELRVPHPSPPGPTWRYNIYTYILEIFASFTKCNWLLNRSKLRRETYVVAGRLGSET